MPLNYFDLNKEIKWKDNDYVTMQLHNLSYDKNGIGQVKSTEIIYDGQVKEVNEKGNIVRAVIQRPIEDGKYEQHTMPLKKVESLSFIDKDETVRFLETYSPFYKEENPNQKYLFTVISGARLD